MEIELIFRYIGKVFLHLTVFLQCAAQLIQSLLFERGMGDIQEEELIKEVEEEEEEEE